MVEFEIIVPQDGPSAALHMVIRAEHWMDAWRRALEELGETPPPAGQVTCRIGPDGAVEVIALESGRRLYVRSRDGDPDDTHGVTRPYPAFPRASAARVPAHEKETVREMDALALRRVAGVEVPSRQPKIRRDLAALPGGFGQEVPYARAFEGGPNTSTDEALDMLRRHVSCEAIHFLEPAEDRKGWIVTVARGRDARDLAGLGLRSKEAIPGPVDGGLGRRTFAGDGVTVRFQRSIGRKLSVLVKSALWAPVRCHDEVVGLLMLLNATRDGGFTDGELRAVRELADLLATRLVRPGSRA